MESWTWAKGRVAHHSQPSRNGERRPAPEEPAPAEARRRRRRSPLARAMRAKPQACEPFRSDVCAVLLCAMECSAQLVTLRLPALPFRIRPLIDLIAFSLQGEDPRVVFMFCGVEGLSLWRSAPQSLLLLRTSHFLPGRSLKLVDARHALHVAFRFPVIRRGTRARSDPGSAWNLLPPCLFLVCRGITVHRRGAIDGDQ
jgi:hypothetical protein